MDIKEKTISLIDALKTVCQSFGLGNDGNEYKIITQVFLYKFINDKFGCEIRKISPETTSAARWEDAYSEMPDNRRSELLSALPEEIPVLLPEQLVHNLWKRRECADFDVIFDQTMTDIAEINKDIFFTRTAQETRIPLFERLTHYVTDEAQRADFARAITGKLVHFSFEEAFDKNYDFFADIFEYLIKDYNTAGGGRYAEYYTPHSIASVMARLLTGNSGELHDVECYDPSAGTGTLLMGLCHQIGEKNCRIYSQDISQRSNKMLKLNLILNGLVSSLDNVIQGDTLVSPYHRSGDCGELRKFDFVVSNPPFKMDFSDTREKLAAMPERFWAGVPKIPAKKKEGMAIYTCFLQHVINSLKGDGKGAVVIPTGFITAKSGVENVILRHLTDNCLVYGCISMPPNLFATTGTNVSVLFLDKSGKSDGAVLIDATGMGEEYRDNGFQKRRLRDNEIDEIVTTFLNRESVEEFSVVVSYDEIKAKNYSLSAGQYFGVKAADTALTPEEFSAEMEECSRKLRSLFEEGNALQNEILRELEALELTQKIGGSE